MLVTYPGQKPSTVRVDQLDQEQEGAGSASYNDSREL